MTETVTFVRPAEAPSLEKRLEMLREVLRPKPAPPAVVSACAPSPDFPGVAAPAGHLARWLAEELGRRIGIAFTESFRIKLDIVASTLPAGELGHLTGRLAGLDTSHPEWLSLIETLTVHETYFMRDPAQFDQVRRHALARIIEVRKTHPLPWLRLWSAACSTGEEAYSLAILALEALAEAREADFDATGTIRLRRPWVIEVLGSDISRQAIRIAQEGVYREGGLSSFRNLPHQYRLFFERVATQRDGATGGGWRVRDDVRRLIKFQQYNLMSSQPPGRHFDVVFCRNVLIYFDAAGRHHVFNLMHQALTSGGYAVFGPTDVVDDPNLFKPQWGPSSVIYQKM